MELPEQLIKPDPEGYLQPELPRPNAPTVDAPEPPETSTFNEVAAVLRENFAVGNVSRVVESLSEDASRRYKARLAGEVAVDADEPVAGYNPFAHPMAHLLDNEDLPRIGDTRSRLETSRVINQIVQQKADRRAIQYAGASAIPWTLGAALTDPVTLLSLAVPVALPATAGSRFVRIAKPAATVLGIEAASEAALHQIKPLRTGGESALNIGASAAASALLGRWATRMPKEELKAVENLVRTEMAAQAADAVGSRPTTVGQLAPDARRIAGGKIIEKLVKIVDAPVPVLRVLATGQDIPEVTDAALTLVESPVLLRGNMENRTFVDPVTGTEMPYAPLVNPESADSLIRKEVIHTLDTMLRAKDEAYAQYVGRVGAAQAMNKTDFGAQVTWALNNRDLSDIPEAAALAAKTRAEVLNPMLDRLVEIGKFSPEAAAKAKEDSSYFMQVYDQELVEQNEAQFLNDMVEWFRENPRLPQETKELRDAQRLLASRGGEEAAEGTAGKDEAAKAFVESAKTVRANRREKWSAARQLEQAEKERDALLAELGDKEFAQANLLPDEVAAALEAKADVARRYDEAVARVKELQKGRSDARSDVQSARHERLQRGKELAKLDRQIDAESRRVDTLRDQLGLLADEASGADVGKLERMAARIESQIGEAEAKVLSLEERRAQKATELLEIESRQTRGLDDVASFRDELNDALREVRDLRKEVAGTKASTLDEAMARADDEIAKLKNKVTEAEARVTELRTRATTADEATDALTKQMRAARRAAKEASADLRKIKTAKAAVARYRAAVQTAREEVRSDDQLMRAALDTLSSIKGERRGAAHIPGVGGTPRPLKERSLDLPYAIKSRYLVTNYDAILEGYVRKVVPELYAHKLGLDDATWGEVRVPEMNAGLMKALEKAPSDAARQELRKNFAAAMVDLEGIRLRTIGRAPRDVGLVRNQNLIRGLRLLRTANYVSKLGKQAVSSTTDLAHVMAKYGLPKTLATLARYLGSPEYRALTKAQANRVSAALSRVDNPVHALSDLSDHITGGHGIGGKIDRFSNMTAEAFSRYTFMSAWNDLVQGITVSMEQDALLRAARNWDKLSEYRKGLVRNAGFSDEDMAYLASAPVDESDGLLRAATDGWTDRRMAQRFETAMFDAARNMTLSRGAGDVAFLMDREEWKTIFQFKSFGVVAINRIMIPVAQGLAHRDASAAVGAAMMLALGANVYVMNSIASGKKPDLSPEKLAKEALGRSGLLGYLPDVSDTVLAFTPFLPEEAKNAIRISRASQYQPVMTSLGPTVGTLANLAQFATNTSKEEANGAQALNQLRQMMWMQNHVIAGRLFDVMEGETADALNLEGATYQTPLERLTTLKELPQ